MARDSAPPAPGSECPIRLELPAFDRPREPAKSAMESFATQLEQAAAALAFALPLWLAPQSESIIQLEPHLPLGGQHPSRSARPGPLMPRSPGTPFCRNPGGLPSVLS